jgi:uncharacterized protein (DUF362 family)
MGQRSSKVVRVRSSLVIGDDGRIDADVLYHMLEAGLEAMSGDGDRSAYLRCLFTGNDTVGMKVNTLGGPGMSTRVELVETLSGMLDDSGLPRKNHIIWDRFDHELKAVGYTVRTRDGPRCFGTDHPGVGYANHLVSKGKIGGLLSRILTEYCSATINVPVLKDHGVSGITCSLKNHYGCIHNPNKYHDNGGDPYIADLNSLEQIRSSQRLIIVDCLKVQFHGGPAYHKSWAADYGGLLLATDPVAVDTIGYGIIEDLRSKAGLEPLKGSKREPIYIKRAAEYGLGSDDPGAIDLKEVKV